MTRKNRPLFVALDAVAERGGEANSLGLGSDLMPGLVLSQSCNRLEDLP
jgi:hypothetical protein